ncbi:MAG: galactokinase [Pseudomonadales bacterium]
MQRSVRAFSEAFGGSPDFRVFSPGRINLIGEHIDYCGGLVLPMAINRGTNLLFSLNNSSKVRIYSARFDEMREFDLADPDPLPTGCWIDYAIGIGSVLSAKAGIDLVVTDDIRSGGLSSSASFTVAVGLAFLKAMDIDVRDNDARISLALAAQSAETSFVGVSCGAMDQVAVTIGGVVKLDCSDFSFETQAADFGHYQIVVMDTGKTRSLAVSAYNERVTQLDSACRILGVTRSSLCRTVDIETLNESAHALTRRSGVLFSRVRHVVTEYQRAQEAAEALSRGDMETLGRLMSASHESLAGDYEVSCGELDLIVRLSQQQPGVVGARMTGAGFGGSAIALVHRDEVERHNDTVARQYSARCGIQPELFRVVPTKGASFY